MRVVIVEDEAPVARRLERLVTELLGDALQSVRVLASLDNARDHLATTPIDLLLLDLNLYGKDGFALLEHAVAGSFHTIVVSANVDQALRAFEYGVADFVPKPFTRARLLAALDRVRGGSAAPHGQATVLAIRCAGQVQVVPLASVAYLRGSGNYAEVVTADGATHLHDKTLDRLQLLLPTRFLRVHRSYIVDTDRITTYRSYPGGRHEATVGTETIPVSRNRIAELRRRMEHRDQ